MSRAERRASIARFKHEVARAHLDVYLIATDATLDSQPLLRDARMNWYAQIETRKPICISCRASFTDDAVQPGLFLLATPSTAPTSCSTSAICVECARDLSPDALDAAATRVLRKLMPNGSFNPADPPWCVNGKTGFACEDAHHDR